MHIGYARCSTQHQDQDLTAQREGLAALGVEKSRVYTDAGYPARTETGRACVRLSPRCGKATPSWSRSWIVSRDL